MEFQGFIPGLNFISDGHCQIRNGLLHTSEVQIYGPETVSCTTKIPELSLRTQQTFLKNKITA